MPSIVVEKPKGVAGREADKALRVVEAAPEAGPAGKRRQVLDEGVLARIAARAPRYDRDNSFFHEDLDELKALGYLRATVPVELGGLGLSLPDLVNEQARLAYHAPSTALALNMHLYWVGAALHLWRKGDQSARFILEEAAAGRIFAAGHGEPGNDLGLAFARTKARPLPDGRYRFEGRKIFTSLSPVWDWLGVHGLDDSDPGRPRIVHAFIRREAPGHRTTETWDTLGVRATRSDDTILEGAIAEAAHVVRVLPVGPPVDDFTDGIASSVMPALGAVYYGIAKRAFDVAITEAKKRTSNALGGRTYAHHPYTAWSAGEASIRLESVKALLDQTAEDWWHQRPTETPWLVRLLASKQHAVEEAKTIVDLAMKIAGAGSLSRRGELERLYRDVRAGSFHPPNTDAVHEVIGKVQLGSFGVPL
ncbi:Acyl-CoA dehydrogenase [Arboricoccus pini]|uniref:Acyl-CoA dehydrogenase n=1 Tax=Arboricoccus pini TaxID=1963835 RepID=A0A212S3A4_9PROT|nr:acyl-CoA dehydrogenase family protein [Arboricoccus pini]SNB79644.1 Acyl-CoA dehydrogenase [Arboricoccus pini]